MSSDMLGARTLFAPICLKVLGPQYQLVPGPQIAEMSGSGCPRSRNVLEDIAPTHVDGSQNAFTFPVLVEAVSAWFVDDGTIPGTNNKSKKS